MGTSVTLSSVPNDFNSDQKSLVKPHLATTVTTVSAGKGKPLPLSPPISVFSTYKRTAKKSDPGADLAGSHAPWEEAESSKTSLSSLEVGWQSAEDGGLAAPKRIRKVESREKLVGK
jgi:hypothetical protein